MHEAVSKSCGLMTTAL